MVMPATYIHPHVSQALSVITLANPAVSGTEHHVFLDSEIQVVPSEISFKNVPNFVLNFDAMKVKAPCVVVILKTPTS